MNIQKSFIDASQEQQTGKLYLVATPIGNLEDMTMRAIRTLQEVDLIAAEDTRQTRKLLTHFEIKTKCVSYHEHNKEASGPELIKLLLEGNNIALVSDAGMPAISDPGEDIVKEAVANEISVIPIPGANAALSALIMSGLPTDRFSFIGFLPRDKKAIIQLLEKYSSYTETLILYESPHRIRKTLAILLEVWGNRKVAIVRELTKRHEEALRGTLTECIDWFEENQPMGEFCILIEGLDQEGIKLLEDAANEWWQKLTLEQHVEHYEATMSRKDAMKQVAGDRGLSKRDVYNEINR
ncbi:MAG: 16S rRNA (cytidine(1402)-2'-O)-methyltransferase [Candidatus Pristimantibacillus lignocellulolyticus]|uniref:Ribosomal RNA small subunit methyltransferase I n=1 Tax=Candidatus Pristimantibacillus lignocellulolyticus TaxID=2994561 RepID=A0A9J6ZIK5_9BACL|nr:MAG: 16S rRNA (cytidine(1402)-2'-O)-methyltransferase [Candidatus Pristimantibacillus lignocellulolyticus]